MIKKCYNYLVGFFVAWYAVVKAMFEMEREEKGYIALPLPLATISMFFLFPFMFFIRGIKKVFRSLR